MHLDSPHDDNNGLLIESFSDGWWYTAAIPGLRRVIACMTDASEVRPLGLDETDGFMERLRGTQHVRRFAEDARPIGLQRVAPANSRRLPHGIGDSPILAVGDAVSTFDPVCGQGIVKALRSGVFASYAIADWMRRGDQGGVKRYWRLADDEFSAYERTLSAYYGLERRWTDRPFWRRRHRADASL
jgi:flavin-dependent dehydrogenase